MKFGNLVLGALSASCILWATVTTASGDDAAQSATPTVSPTAPPSKTVTTEIRDVLFGDLPLEKWPMNSAGVAHAEPWASFLKVRKQLQAGQHPEAIRTLRRVLSMRNLESRHYLQAWHFLRGLGVQPTKAEAKHVYGVVVEVALPEGLDIVAAYADGSARYFNYSGAAVIWEKPDDSLKGQIQSLLQAGQKTANKIGPWLKERPPAPATGESRITMLTPSGLHFGQAPMDVLAADPLAKPVFDAATQLMLALIGKQQKAPKQKAQRSSS